MSLFTLQSPGVEHTPFFFYIKEHFALSLLLNWPLLVTLFSLWRVALNTNCRQIAPVKCLHIDTVCWLMGVAFIPFHSCTAISLPRSSAIKWQRSVLSECLDLFRHHRAFAYASRFVRGLMWRTSLDLSMRKHSFSSFSKASRSKGSSCISSVSILNLWPHQPRSILYRNRVLLCFSCSNAKLD